MVDADLVTAKLADLDDRVARIRQYRPHDVADLRRDRDAREIIAFNLMLAVQSALDVASHVIADESWEPATTLARAFEILHERGVISRKTADALGNAAGFRNVVAHGYGGVDLDALHSAATEGPDDLMSFAREVTTWMKTASG